MKVDNEPTVPDRPTIVGGATGPDEVDTVAGLDEGDEEVQPAAGAQNRKSKIVNNKSTGGRRPYEEILEENRVLADRVKELTAALRPFARLPDDRHKKAEDVLYKLVRGEARAELTCGQLRAARQALDLD